MVVMYKIIFFKKKKLVIRRNGDNGGEEMRNMTDACSNTEHKTEGIVRRLLLLLFCLINFHTRNHVTSIGM